MKLYLVQHAKATSEQADPERPLTEEGHREIQKVAAFIKPLNLAVDYLWHSGKMKTNKSHSTTLVIFLGLTSILGCVELAAAAEPNYALEKLPHTFDFGPPYHPETSLIFKGSFPKVPKMMIVYKVKDPNITEASAREMARKYFGMSADAELKHSPVMGLYWLKSPTWRFEVNPGNGSFNLCTIRKKGTQVEVKGSYPSKDECQAIAIEYLKTHKLLEEDAYLWGVVDNTAGADVMSVDFGRLIGGYKTWGAGAKIRMHIGLGEEVVEVRKTWQELVPYKMYPVKSPEEALEDLRNGMGVLMHGGVVKVREITFRYYTSPIKQEYVQPIYYFDCNGSDGPFYGVVSAIRSEYLKPRVDVSSLPMTWIKCRNPQCRAEYQITLKEYFKFAESYLEEHPDSATPPSLVCKVCGNDSGYRAVKCEKCGLIFEAGWKGSDYYDRCPRCKFSKAEERMNKLQPRQ